MIASVEDLASRLDFATSLAHQAGKIMLEHFRVGIKRTLKADNSPVTIADTAINALVLQAIREAYPKASILAEEESSLKPDADDVWVCDPLDGTIPYTLGVPTSMFSLALVRQGRPVLGVLYDPYLDRLYTATKEHGAQLNNKPLTVNQFSTLSQQYTAMPSSSSTPLLNAKPLISGLLDHNGNLFSVSSATYESALVATGELVGAIYPWSSPWDIAAVKIIVEAAGGRVTSLTGEEQAYDQAITGAIVSNGLVHDELIKLVAAGLTVPIQSS